MIRTGQVLEKTGIRLGALEAASCRFPQHLRLEAAAPGRIQCHSEFHPDQEI